MPSRPAPHASHIVWCEGSHRLSKGSQELLSIEVQPSPSHPYLMPVLRFLSMLFSLQKYASMGFSHGEYCAE